MYFTNREVFVIILMQTNNSKDGPISNLDPYSFRIIGFSSSQMRAPIII